MRYLFVSASLLIACTRSVPTSFPTASAASPEAEPAPAAVVTRTLDEEPPLPGEPMDGWEALGREAAGHSGHSRHSGHSGHGGHHHAR